MLTGAYALWPNLEDVQLAARQKKVISIFRAIFFRFESIAN
jgi:hypothetical protein